MILTPLWRIWRSWREKPIVQTPAEAWKQLFQKEKNEMPFTRLERLPYSERLLFRREDPKRSARFLPETK